MNFSCNIKIGKKILYTLGKNNLFIKIFHLKSLQIKNN